MLNHVESCWIMLNQHEPAEISWNQLRLDPCHPEGQCSPSPFVAPPCGQIGLSDSVSRIDGFNWLNNVQHDLNLVKPNVKPNVKPMWNPMWNLPQREIDKLLSGLEALLTCADHFEKWRKSVEQFETSFGSHKKLRWKWLKLKSHRNHMSAHMWLGV